MEISNFKKVRNFIEYYGKPFTGDLVASETGLTLQQSIKVLNKMSNQELIKPISKKGKFSIYIKNINYVEENPTNNYNFEIKFLKSMLRKVKTGNYTSVRQLSEILDGDRRKVTRYLVALCSIGMVDLVNGKYKVIKDVDLLLIGSKFDSNILRKLKSKESEFKEGVIMGRKEKILVDASGREYPAKILDPEIVKRDTIVNRLMGKASRLHDRIESEKIKMVDDIDKYLNQTAQKYGEEWKGNAELLSFDGKYKIEVRQRERIEFSEKLQIAKQKIDGCLKRWSEDSNINLQAVIKEAFQVDKKGEIAKSRILGLRRYNIKDKQWQQAMDLIDEAIQVTSTKQYIAFYERPDKDKPFRLISLNFSAL